MCWEAYLIYDPLVHRYPVGSMWTIMNTMVCGISVCLTHIHVPCCDAVASIGITNVIMYLSMSARTVHIVLDAIRFVGWCF